MAMKFYNVEKVAEILGITPAEVNAKRETQELHGYRDGADWKFKAEEIDALAAKKEAAGPAVQGIEDDDALVSEVELGESDPSTSGTVIGPPPAEALGSSLSGFEDLNLAPMESGLDVTGVDMTGASNVSGLSELDLAAEGLEDDDLVLGASAGGSGSDLTIGGDSGISLLDPADSGLSLEEPLDLGAGSQSLGLSGDDVLGSAKKSSAPEAPTDLAADSDFMLTPMDELSEGEESSSQVIALEGEGDSGELQEVAVPLDSGIGGALDSGVFSGSAAGLAEAMPLEAVAAGPAAPAARGPDFGAAAQQVAAAAAPAALPEAPYSALNIAGLAFCTVVLLIVGMMMYDLVRNMWQWNQPTAVSSWLMDLLLGR
jgi:hypothetical protein